MRRARVRGPVGLLSKRYVYVCCSVCAKLFFSGFFSIDTDVTCAYGWFRDHGACCIYRPFYSTHVPGVRRR